MKKDCDLVIAGCGMAGAVAGLTALKRGLHTCIVEKNRREFIGQKMCGELTTQKMVKWLTQEFGVTIEQYLLKGLEVCSSSEHTSHVNIPLCTVDRLKFGQLLVKALLEKGVKLHQGTVKNPLGTSTVKGVHTKDAAFHSTVTIDCTGVSAVLRRKVFSSDPHMLGLTYKTNLILREPVNMDYARLMFNMDVVPSGYSWCFPKSEYEVNVGVGGLAHSQKYLKEKLERVITTLKVTVKRREHTGFGVVPLGPPLPSMVYPGLLVCGDAAYQVNPLTGEGIAPAIKAGYYAGQTAAEAVHANDNSVEMLWKYNVDFARTYGGKHASLFVARNFLISLSNEDLAYLLKNIVTDEELTNLIEGIAVQINMKNVNMVLRNWRKFNLLYRLFRVFNLMKMVKKLYTDYPEQPEGLAAWKQNVTSCMHTQI